ncbi:MAG TPA: adenosylmethionine--8-amino-7-oxononanoate transaminase [Deltaproteobacteria bacterium]|nr:adenosylmethionine--8-amino-7-oxononanoate transaminase [Deltaproteobacteria bacterium]
MAKERESGRTAGLRELDRAHVWHPFTQMREWEGDENIIIERGSGVWLIDTEGRRYIDGVSSLWVTVHGHRRREIDRAVREQLGRIAHTTLLGLGSPPSIELARRLVELAPRGLEHVFYSDNGSTAVEVAMKMAFQYWQQAGGGRHRDRQKFVAFSGAYHGDTFGSMSVGEIDIFVDKYRPLLFETFRAPYPYCYRCPLDLDRDDCGLACLDELEAILRDRRHEIAACIIEPIFEGASGMITAPEGFLRAVRRLTRKYGILLIADEVAAGFGRTGAMFACEKEGVSPDFLCLAKGLTGGYLPLAATLTTRKIYRAFLGRYESYRAFFHGHTYTGNPLGCAAALANLDIFERERVIEGLAPKTELLGRLLRRFSDHPNVGDVRHVGLVAGIELVRDRASKEPFPPSMRVGRRITLAAARRGLITRPLGDTLVIMPPLSIRPGELRRLVDILYDSMVEVLG